MELCNLLLELQSWVVSAAASYKTLALSEEYGFAWGAMKHELVQWSDGVQRLAETYRHLPVVQSKFERCSHILQECVRIASFLEDP